MTIRTRGPEVEAPSKAGGFGEPSRPPRVLLVAILFAPRGFRTNQRSRNPQMDDKSQTNKPRELVHIQGGQICDS